MILDASGALVRTITAHDGAVTDMAFTPDGANLISAGADGWLRSWDTERGSLVWERHDLGAAKGITLDASGSLVAARWPKAGSRIRVADVDTGHVVRTFGGLHHLALAALGPDGAWLAMSTTGSSGVEAGRIVPVIGDGAGVTFGAPQWRGINGDVSWSPDARFLSGSAYVWDTATGELVHTAWEHDATVVDSAWSSDGTRLATAGGSDGTAKVWTLAPGFGAVLTLPAAGPSVSAVTDVAFSADGLEVVTASDAVRIWDVRPLGDGEVASLSLPTVYAGQVSFTPSGTLVIARDLGDEAALLAWEVGRFAPVAIGPNRTLPNAWFDVNPLDESVLELNADGTFSLLTETSTRRLPIEAGLAAWAPDSVHIVTTPTHDTVALGSLDGREEWRTTLPISIGALAVGPGATIAVAGGDTDPERSVFVLDGADGSVVSTIPTHADQLTFDPRGGAIAVLEGGQIQLWDMGSARLIGTFPDVGAQPVFSFSPDGSTLAVMGSDRSVRLYGTDSRVPHVTLPPPENDPGREFCYAKGIAFSLDGSMLASQGCDGVRVWTLDIDELLAIARTNVTRTLTAAECRQFLHVAPC